MLSNIGILGFTLLLIFCLAHLRPFEIAGNWADVR
ncbi:hypothetical protein M493_04970 [Geobacillus genomosp. 3]|uniref:Uncharacterized protein n=1 Tax=Geobacillus genomosp. 3 TaxID=1921421 RepID=S6A0Q9_GEOG3|nr:hypothetical protein M493_04970 [Geobacillus genomosp. 3]